MSNGQAEHIEQDLLAMEYYVPAFEIYLGKNKLQGELKRDVMNISYSDNLESIDSFSFTVSNWDAERLAFRYLDFEDNPFNVGKEVEVWMGYADNLQRMIYGEITSLEPNFPQSGSPTLNVRGLNVLHRLRNKQETHFYKNKTDGYIARKIAQRLGLEIGRIEKGNKHAFIAQKNRYDIVFLLERARRLGYEVTVEDKMLNFETSTNTTRTKYVLEWGKSLINFKPSLTTAGQVSEVIVKGWSPQKKKTITGKAKRRDLKTKGLGARNITEIIEKAFNQRIEVIVDRPIRDEKEAKELAKQKLEQIAKDLIIAEGTTLGLPDYRTGSLVEIHLTRDLNDAFSGNYYVTETTHSIGNSGYTTKFKARREEAKEKS